MARLRRAELFDPSEIAVVHVMNRVVRRCFLMGHDPVSGKNFDHRKRWVEREIERSAAWFGIDLIAFSLMSNHLHLVLRSRPDVVQDWEDSEVAYRWLMLCPKRKHQDGTPRAPSEPELNSIRCDPVKLAEIRRRLSDISWWMRLMCQRIAQRANAEDSELGKFWQSRYRAVRLLDEAAILACAAYVDLNPIRAALAETLETSSFTSVARRIQAMAGQESEDPADALSSRQAGELDSSGEPAPHGNIAHGRREPADACLSPVQIDELKDALGPRPSGSPLRCSDKGFTSLTAGEYVQLLDWTARQLVPGKAGATPADAPPIFERLQLRREVWCELVKNFGTYFSLVAGQVQCVDAHRSRTRRQRFHLKAQTCELLAG
jgi:hypothetical protein